MTIMKAINNIFLGLTLAAGALTFNACTGDLDVPIQNPNQLPSAEFAKDPEVYDPKIYMRGAIDCIKEVLRHKISICYNI